MPNEGTSRRMSLPSQSLYKCKQVACSVVVACLLAYTFFYIDVNKSIIFVFGAFVYHFKNTISILVTILEQYSLS